MPKRDDPFDRNAGHLATVVVWIVLACIATILIGLSVTIPWLGIPLGILAVIGYHLAG